MTGTPDKKHISTSYIERANLTMRMGMRRFTRLTNAHSKKLENHEHAIALFYMHYNFCRISRRIPALFQLHFSIGNGQKEASPG